jgi:D-3-phosphoglycerate dehydrogenase
MKPDSILVNTSRAGLIEKGALVARSRQAGRAAPASTSYETEPVLNGDHPLLKLNNVVCTPHLGYVERATYEALYGAAVDQVFAFAAGKPINVVKP